MEVFKIQKKFLVTAYFIFPPPHGRTSRFWQWLGFRSVYLYAFLRCQRQIFIYEYLRNFRLLS